MMNFESLKQIIRFEVSRFPFVPEERQKSLRRAYRALEAVLRDSARGLEFGWGEAKFLPPKIFSVRLEEIVQGIRGTCTEYGNVFSPEMRNGLENLCEHLRKLRESVINAGQESGNSVSVKELAHGLEELKKALGTVHRM
jgi:ATP phosphoribosyltransferase regulatory subunit HisZ